MTSGGVDTNALLRALNSTDTDMVAAAARIAGTSRVTAVAPQIIPIALVDKSRRAIGGC